MTDDILLALDNQLDQIASTEGSLTGYSIYLPPFLKKKLFPDANAYRGLPLVVNKYIPVIHNDEGYNTGIFVVHEHHGPEVHRWAHIAELCGDPLKWNPRSTGGPVDEFCSITPRYTSDEWKRLTEGNWTEFDEQEGNRRDERD